MTVLNTISNSLVKFATTRGIKAQELLEGLPCTAAALQKKDGRVWLEVETSIWERLAARTGDPQLGLHLSRLLNPLQVVGVSAYIAGTFGTVAEAFYFFERYAAILLQGICYETKIIDDEVIIRERVSFDSNMLSRHRVEFTWGIFLRVLERRLGSRVVPKRMTFMHPGPEDPTPLAEVFSPQLSFGSGYVEVVLAREIWQHRSGTPDAVLQDYLLSVVDRSRTAVDKSADVREKVEALLTDRLSETANSAEGIASSLGMSQRTLRRRLADENTTLREILDATRKQAALAHLRDPTYTLSDVALLVGFSDQSAFVRAFKRWTSTTPRDYRRQLTSL